MSSIYANIYLMPADSTYAYILHTFYIAYSSCTNCTHAQHLVCSTHSAYMYGLSVISRIMVPYKASKLIPCMHIYRKEEEEEEETEQQQFYQFTLGNTCFTNFKCNTYPNRYHTQ